MKHHQLFIFCTITLLSGMAHAKLSIGCTEKKDEVKNQIAYAKAHNNTHQIAGLQEALHNIEEHCTESQLLKQHQLKIEEKSKKVAERQAELEQASETGDNKKISQKQKKLERAREELRDAQNETYQ
ncbi:DUF1090 domain-containing protein [Citrobacter freundii]|nr:DUF1090 domain-containing protein [Citrobacter freundii]